MLIALKVVEEEFARLGYDTWITSGSDGQHKEGSLHPKGDALDFRTKHVDKAIVLAEIVDRVRARLEPQYDVLLNDLGPTIPHLHVEYDPK